ncbi:MAG: hypothetical protein KDK41_18075, partial [Leptospiraceae bacterium]|nr:hypothetical protein [Leptospiraceae bacterium]
KISRAGELSELEIATVLTAPTVVAQYCQTDTTGSRFLQFGDGKKRYFPDAVVMSNLQYSNSLNNVLLSLLDSHLLRRNTSQKSGGQLYLSNDTSQEGRRDGLFEARLLHQFCSSPAEAISCLEKMHIEEGYENMRFVDQSKLTNLVTALLPEANKILKEDDIKFKFLTQIIEKHSDEKIVIFCIYKKTADYLYSKISKKFKNLKVGLTSEQNTDQLEALLEDFAPIANNMIDPEVHDEFSEKVRENKVDILIATEAISEGFNLQDARLLVNYDLPWTILNLAQRMGRILRPWHKPRKIQIWNFIPDTMFSENFPHAVSWAERLNSRNKAQQSFTRLPAFGSNDKEEIQLYTIADTFAQNSDVEINLDDTLQFIQSTEGIQTSSAIDDLGRISEEEAREIRSLKSGFRAVITAQDLGINEDLRFPLLYLLIRRKSRVFAGLFSRDCELLIPFDHQLEILNNIRLQQRQEKMYNLQEAELIEYDKLLTGSLKEFAQLLKCNEDDLKIICSMKIVT